MATITLDVLNSLPPPEIVESVVFQTIYQEQLAIFVALQPEYGLLLESDPVVKLIQVYSYREFLLRNRINAVYEETLVPLASGSNLDVLGGFYDTVRLLNETDDRFRERIVLEISGRSTGGTAPRYRAKAMEASIEVKDVVVYREGVSPVVNVAVLSTAIDGIALAPLLATVSAALNAEAVRMVNDTLVIRSAVTVTENITAQVWLLPETPQTVFDTLDETLRALWLEQSSIGFDLTVSWVQSRLMQPGVYKVVVTAPVADVVRPTYEAVALGTINLTYMGRLS